MCHSLGTALETHQEDEAGWPAAPRDATPSTSPEPGLQADANRTGLFFLCGSQMFMKQAQETVQCPGTLLGFDYSYLPLLMIYLATQFFCLRVLCTQYSANNVPPNLRLPQNLLQATYTPALEQQCRFSTCVTVKLRWFLFQCILNIIQVGKIEGSIQPELVLGACKINQGLQENL